MNTPPKGRARLVCTQCHGRKIKCDLEDSLDDTCTYCRGHQTRCIRRQGLRKRNPQLQRKAANRQHQSATSPLPQPDVSLPVEEQDQDTTFADGENNSAYIAEYSVLQSADQDARRGQLPPLAQTSQKETAGSTSNTLAAKILQATDAHKLPKPALRQALFDAFFDNLSYCFPVVDRRDVESPGSSILLQQAVCLAGSLLRHPNLPDSFPRAQAIYEKVKLLICINYEQDMLVVLKSLCLLMLWSPAPSHVVCLDGPWHATGSAVRLAVQMGLHKRSTYDGKPDRSCRRRIWWLLYGSDCVQALIYGRIPVLDPRDFDVPPLTEDDFDKVDLHATNFIADISLSCIMGELALHNARRTAVSSSQGTHIIQSICDWRSRRPPQLSLYDTTGRRTPYCFPITELHVQFFGTVILSQAMTYQFAKRWPCSKASLVAATCLAGLYEEVLYRDQTALLSAMHAFWCLTAAIPLIYYKPATEPMESQRKESLETLCAVIEQLRVRFGVAGSVSRKVSILLSEQSDLLSQQLTGGTATPAPMGNSGEDSCNTGSQFASERQLLDALFPELPTWSGTWDEDNQNPILKSVAQTHVQRAAEALDAPMEWICELPLSMFDMLGDAALLEPFLDDQYVENDAQFQF